MYETDLSLPGSGAVAGIAWMDTRLLSARMYSGSDQSPGIGPWRYTAPIEPAAARTVVAAFNSGFKIPSAEGGYYTQGRWVVPPRTGAATLVIFANGRTALGAWGSGLRMRRTVVAVRQNLNLLVAGGRPLADARIVGDWGVTLGGVANTWRSGLGVTRNGALVYVTGPDLDPLSLAELLIRAGAVRAMELDINPDWTILATYRPATRDGEASARNGTGLIAGTVREPGIFFEQSWARDFITMSARTARP